MPAGIINTGTHPKALWPGVKAWFGLEYDKHSPQWPDLFEQETSDKKYEEEVEQIGFGMATVKPEGESITYDSASQGYTARYTHVAYASGYMVTHEERKDNLYEAVSRRRAPDLAFSMRQTEEYVHANVYNRAFTSGYTGGDGVILCSASHPTVYGLQSNLLTSADLSETAIEDALTQIGNAVDARGRKINLQGQTLHVSTSDQFEAARIMKSVLQNDTANNAINVIKAMGLLPGGVKVNNYFTSTSAWFIRTNARRGMRHFTREAVMFDQDNDFDTKNAKASVYARWSQGWSDWRGVYGNAGV
jgi:hypothetical protein